MRLHTAQHSTARHSIPQHDSNPPSQRLRQVPFQASPLLRHQQTKQQVNGYTQLSQHIPPGLQLLQPLLQALLILVAAPAVHSVAHAAGAGLPQVGFAPCLKVQPAVALTSTGSRCTIWTRSHAATSQPRTSPPCAAALTPTARQLQHPATWPARNRQLPNLSPAHPNTCCAWCTPAPAAGTGSSNRAVQPNLLFVLFSAHRNACSARCHSSPSSRHWK